jgi:hypothetical protein
VYVYVYVYAHTSAYEYVQEYVVVCYEYVYGHDTCSEGALSLGTLIYSERECALSWHVLHMDRIVHKREEEDTCKEEDTCTMDSDSA